MSVRWQLFRRSIAGIGHYPCSYIVTSSRRDIKHNGSVKLFSRRVHLDLLVHECLSAASDIGSLAYGRDIVEGVGLTTILTIVSNGKCDRLGTLHGKRDEALAHILVIGLPSVNGIANFLNYLSVNYLFIFDI